MLQQEVPVSKERGRKNERKCHAREGKTCDCHLTCKNVGVLKQFGQGAVIFSCLAAVIMGSKYCLSFSFISVLQHVTILECTCHIVSYLADVTNALSQTGGQGPSHLSVDGEERAIEVDSDWVEELAVEEEDSQAEDSVGNSHS